MTWNWQHHNWPHFSWSNEGLQALEAQFLKNAGILIGISKHLNDTDHNDLVLDMVTDEALKTSEIEGEYLDRASIQSSIRKNMGLQTDHRQVGPGEKGIAELMVDLYQNFDQALSHELLFRWHEMLMQGRRDINDVGKYRTHPEPMQVISGPYGKQKIHFEAPPSNQVEKEMDRFIRWNASTVNSCSLGPLAKSAIAHLYFVSIHPFEDGNGRIARAISEKVLAQSLGQPSLIALAQTIHKYRNEYYDALEANNKDLEISPWLLYFSKTLIAAQTHSLKLVDFLIKKAKFYDSVKNQINGRQEKVISRMLREGPEGFKGGLSAENYISISKTSRATATRDLQDLVRKKILTKTGELKSTRYYLMI